MELGSADASTAEAAGSGDIAARVADTIEAVVDAVHDRAIRPLLLVARGIVYGIVAGTMALVVAVVLAITLVRVLDVYAFGNRVWASDALIGAVLCAAGAVAWHKRRPAGEER
ncbi:MAG: hypothetical protein M0Z63_01870 [Actinomycetota bacterium]|jgi:hypothetical protein|nr:hypothetical protein [Actinomycetota bacterium]MDA8279169.1 hypothetical protein [Actinomycetota bacterium]